MERVLTLVCSVGVGVAALDLRGGAVRAIRRGIIVRRLGDDVSLIGHAFIVRFADEHPSDDPGEDEERQHREHGGNDFIVSQEGIDKARANARNAPGETGSANSTEHRSSPHPALP